MVTLSNEEIVSALLSNGTNKATAEALGISESYLYKRMRTPAFQATLKEAKAVVFKTFLESAQRNMIDAVSTMVEIMNDQDCSPQIRLNAAQAVVSTVTRLQNSAVTERKENEYLRWSI